MQSPLQILETHYKLAAREYRDAQEMADLAQDYGYERHIITRYTITAERLRQKAQELQEAIEYLKSRTPAKENANY